MDQTERQVIDELFGKLRQAEAGLPPRDAEADGYIAEQLGRQPGAPYYMAQAIVVQEQALKAAQERIAELERQPAAGGGFLGGLFGGPQPTAQPRGAPSMEAQQLRGYQQRGGGFLGGAMQTAVGVAGGVILGNMLADMFSADEAAAAEPPIGDIAADDELVPDDEMEFDDGGDFDSSDF